MIEPKQALIEEIQKMPIGVDVDAQRTRLAAIEFLSQFKDGCILPTVRHVWQGEIEFLEMNFELKSGYQILAIFYTKQQGAI